jgi:hypothetical protein
MFKPTLLHSLTVVNSCDVLEFTCALYDITGISLKLHNVLFKKLLTHNFSSLRVLCEH